MYAPDDAERARHEKACHTLMLQEGSRGLVTYGIVATAGLTALHFLSSSGSMWRGFRPKVWVLAASMTAGFAIRAETSGLACARNPPWLTNAEARN